MISVYVNNGDLICVRKLFDDMFERNIVLWNFMIIGYCYGCMMGEVREFLE